MRDYIHVVDLAQGHVAALRYLERAGRSITANPGTGRGYSVLELVRAFEAARGSAAGICAATRGGGSRAIRRAIRTEALLPARLPSGGATRMPSSVWKCFAPAARWCAGSGGCMSVGHDSSQ